MVSREAELVGDKVLECRGDVLGSVTSFQKLRSSTVPVAWVENRETSSVPQSEAVGPGAEAREGRADCCESRG